ncbi:MAG: hypothetical protein JHD31_03680 [Rhodoluna sp.]|jgi:hypothetical protein|nr:hypothetical protein [Rhodoluna sp.]
MRLLKKYFRVGFSLVNLLASFIPTRSWGARLNLAAKEAELCLAFLGFGLPPLLDGDE